MLTSITNEIATSTGDQVSSTAAVATPPVSTDPTTAIDISLKPSETSVLDQADIYSLDNNHLLQVSPSLSSVLANIMSIIMFVY